MSLSFGKNKELSVSKLNVDGFDKLTDNQKQLVYHLSKAGEYGHRIYLEQRFEKLNNSMMDVFKSIYENFDKESNQDLFSRFEETFMTFIFHNGIYHSYSGRKIEPLFSLDEFDQLVKSATSCKQSSCAKNEVIDSIKSYIFEEIKYGLGQEQGFYSKNMTEDKMKEYISKNFTQTTDRPSYGISSTFSLNEKGEVIENKFSTQGREKEIILKIVDELNEALKYTEGEHQHKSIEHLIKFYETGDPKYYDLHSIEWVQDKDSDIYYVHGFIETYLDPLKMCGSFESIVGFKDPEKTKVVNLITDNIQYFEDNMPVHPDFKKEEAVGLSASSIQVVSCAGEAYPVLPLGINLPNSDWVREKYGSKSVNLDNVAGNRANKDKVYKEFYLPEYFEQLMEYGQHSNTLHTDLHEITGHGSGRTLPETPNGALGEFESIIEEARADLAALYHIADPKIQEFGIIPDNFNVEKYAETQYVMYFTNALINQLKRVPEGDDLKQTHMRNRHLISSWLLNYCTSGEMEMVENDGKHFVKVNSVPLVRKYLGILLGEVQRIKSEGDYKFAHMLVSTYGTKINSEMHKEATQRYESLSLPSFIGFETPILLKDDNGVKLGYVDNFIERSMDLIYKVSDHKNKKDLTFKINTKKSKYKH